MAPMAPGRFSRLLITPNIAAIGGEPARGRSEPATTTAAEHSHGESHGIAPSGSGTESSFPRCTNSRASPGAGRTAGAGDGDLGQADVRASAATPPSIGQDGLAPW